MTRQEAEEIANSLTLEEKLLLLNYLIKLKKERKTMLNKTLLFAKIREKYGSILAYSKKANITRAGLYHMKRPDYETLCTLAQDLSLSDAEFMEMFFPGLTSPAATTHCQQQT